VGSKTLPALFSALLGLASAAPASGAEPSVEADLPPAAPLEQRAGETGSDEILSTETQVLHTATLTGVDRLLEAITNKRVVFVGESHDRYEDHLNQLAVIEGLHAQGRDLAIGMEFFQQPFQAQVDAFISGDIDEAEFLRGTEYFDRWRYDYRLYRPILRFARDHQIPVIALNLEAELTSKVGKEGLDALTPEERARIPQQMDQDDPAYRERVMAVFEMHPNEGGQDFENFLLVQLLWDEGMADRAARYLAEHPEKTLVVLAGAGHVEYGYGIPRRLLRRMDVSVATILNGSSRTVDPAAADFLLFPRRVELPANGLLGVLLDQGIDEQGARVQGFADNSGAKDAGMEEGDRIVRIADRPVTAYADVRIALIDSRPGQRIPVEVMRERVIGGDERLTFEVELH
jgi:uncharacterized iron-regulated protein